MKGIWKVFALVVIAALCLTGFAAVAEEAELTEATLPEGAKLVKPMDQQIDLENVPDGIYPVEFGSEDLVGDELELTIYTEDDYDIVDIETLAVGDYILIDGEILLVEKLDKDEYGDLQINGGLDEDGYDLRPYDEDNCWKVAGFDDFPTWTEQGDTKLSLDDAVTFTDSSDIESDPITATGIDAVTEAIENTEEDFFDEYSTTVRVEDGRIVDITRVYVP